VKAERTLPFLAVLFAMAGFQSGAAVAKGLFPAVGPLGTATLRLVLGGLLLLAIIRPWRDWPKSAPVIPLFGLGVSVAVAVTAFYAAIERLPLGVALPLQFLGPLGVAIFGSRKLIDVVWAILAGAGVWLLVGAGQDIANVDVRGLPWAFAAAAGWAGYILFGRVASAAFGRSTAALATCIAAILVLPVGISNAGAALLDLDLLPLAVVVAVLAVALPFSLEMYALPRMPARTFATFTSLEPAFAALFGFVLLHERLALSQLTGVAAVMIAAAGAAWSSVERRQSIAPT
jgi:inner membrane transporter RhtA